MADRFMVDACGQGIDLATGARVRVTVASAGGPTEQARWAERCAWLSSVVHPSLAALVDYGALGESQRFEAWETTGAWTGSVAAARRVGVRASAFLSANRRAASDDDEVVSCGERRGAIIAGAATAIAVGASDNPTSRVDQRAWPGILRPPDPRLQAIGEMLGSDSSGRITALAVWAADGRATEAAVRQIARAARLAGYVPVATAQCADDRRRLLIGRSLLVVARDVVDGWQCVVNLALHNPKPHIVLFVGSAAVRRVHTLHLHPLPIEALMRSVCPPEALRLHTRPIASAARRSRGWLHRFEELLLAAGGDDVLVRPGRRVRSSYEQNEERPTRAAEQVATYVAEQAASPDRGSGPAWSTKAELQRLRRHLTSAGELVKLGRHQRADRVLRQIMHAFARRGEWREASRSALLLAEALLRRGRVAAAEGVLDAACSWVERARELPLSQRAGVLRAEVLLERGRAAECESVLETVLASAVSAQTDVATEAGLALVRCLYWRGHYLEAWQRLSFIETESREVTRDQVRTLTARSRVAIGLERVADAVALGARARDLALSLDDPALSGSALYACALAQFAASDRLQAEAVAVQAADAARRAHDPMLALDVRILRAEIARRHGHRAPAAVLVRRTAKLSTSLPATVRCRIELLRDTLTGSDVTAAAEARARATGLHAVRLFAPTRPSLTTATASADEIAELMRCCQVADDDATVLAALCGRLRRRLQAAAVAFFAVDREQLVSIAGEGSRIDPVVPARVLTANQLVSPQAGERVEGGVPVRYSGRVVGVLVATWTPAAPFPAADASLLLPVAATAAGPALSAVVSKRAADVASRMADLIGVSRAIADVRDAVERAAAAPFAVLVEGESGSGKELVARLLHKRGTRRDRAFCTLNCAALPEDLVESELFGHARGAFTGAAAERRGVFEDAHGGTLFLDEIGELSARAQAKLLRAIQEGEIRRVGENVCRRVDVRLVTATNRDLRAEVVAGRFRADLLYRLDVVRIVLPPLRDRRDDIPVLAEHYWREATLRVGSHATLGVSTIAALCRYDWPGNIRELQNVLAALAVRCGKRGVVPPTALPPHFSGGVVAESFRLDVARRLFERSFIRAALVRAGGQRTRAAEQLGVSRQGLAKLIARLEINDSGGAEA